LEFILLEQAVLRIASPRSLDGWRTYRLACPVAEPVPGREKLKSVYPALQQRRQILGDRQYAIGDQCRFGFTICDEPGSGLESLPIALEIDEAEERQPELVERKSDVGPGRETDIDDRYFGHRFSSFRVTGVIRTW
jgi:hypothetical protein